MSGAVPLFDLPAFAAALAGQLAQAGIPIAPNRTTQLIAALELLPPLDRTSLYWSTRLVVLTGREQLPAFDAVFDRLFPPAPPGRGHGDCPARPSTPVTLPPPPLAIRPAAPRPWSSFGPRPSPWETLTGRGSPAACAPPRPRAAPPHPPRLESIPTVASSAEKLAAKHFAALTEEELAQALRLLAALKVHTPLRPTRRHRPGSGTTIDLRRTLRHSQRSGGDPARLIRTKPALRRRPLVMLCDISGSMEPHTRAYLQFFHRAVANAVQAEAFVFSTRLTRLTRELRAADADQALRAAGAHAPDWSGGTRIGASLATFNDAYGRAGMARGAVVVIFSDGWERDPPDVLGREMARLARLAHRVVWVNPRTSAPGYAPRVGGMNAALPYVDTVVSGHSVGTLIEVIHALASAGEGRPGRCRREGEQCERS